MNDCKEINKDAVVNKLRTMYTAYMVTGNPTSATLFRDAADLIDQKSYLYERALSDVVRLSAERKTGQWIKAVDELGETWMCSECCEEWTVEESAMDEFPQWARYYPNCGTRMVNNDV